MARPYQPSLLRLLHGGTAGLVAITWLSGLLIYSRYDGRWGRLPFAVGGDWIDLHGTAGSMLLPVALLLGVYAFILGFRKLLRSSNAVALGALALAIGTGMGMNGDWLEAGNLHELLYTMHLGAWLLLTLALATHLGGVIKLGGWRLARSMFSPRLRGGDWPWHWPGQLLRRFR